MLGVRLRVWRLAFSNSALSFETPAGFRLR
jgi:hypothetical protein